MATTSFFVDPSGAVFSTAFADWEDLKAAAFADSEEAASAAVPVDAAPAAEDDA